MFQDSDDDSDNGINEEYVEDLLRKIDAGTAGYIDVDDLMEAYDLLHNAARYDDGVKLIDYGLTLKPTNVTLLLTKATTLVDRRQLAEAEKLLDFVEKDAKNNHDYYVCRGWLSMKYNDSRKAEKFFDLAVESGVDEAEKDAILTEIASNLTQQEWFDLAVKYFERISTTELEAQPTLEFEYAYSLERIGKDKKATKAYEHVVSMSPLYESAWYNLGIQYSKKEAMNKAIEAYDNAICIKPDYPEPYFNKANALMFKEKWADAIECYTEYVSLVFEDELCSAAYMYVGECWEQMGNDELANRCYVMATQKDARNDQAWYDIGSMMVRNGNNEGAVDAFERASTVSLTNPNYYFASAQAYLNLNMPEKALAKLERGLLTAPGDVLAWFETVKLFYTLHGDSVSALKKYIEKKTMEFGHPPALMFVTAYMEYFLFNKKRAAFLTLERVALMAPNVILDACEEPNLMKFLDIKEVRSLLDTYNIKY